MRKLTEEEILQYNKMCAEFLGKNMINKNHEVEFTSPSYAEGKFWISEKWMNIEDPDGNNLISIIDMKFHSDWNWIMEVCIGLGMEFVTTNKEQLIQQIYDKLRSMETNS